MRTRALARAHTHTRTLLFSSCFFSPLLHYFSFFFISFISIRPSFALHPSLPSPLLAPSLLMLPLNHERRCHMDKLSPLAGATNTPFPVFVSLRPRSPFSQKKGVKRRGRREVFYGGKEKKRGRTRKKSLDKKETLLTAFCS